VQKVGIGGLVGVAGLIQFSGGVAIWDDLHNLELGIGVGT